jgi:hypothetical protein
MHEPDLSDINNCTFLHVEQKQTFGFDSLKEITRTDSSTKDSRKPQWKAIP